MSNFYSMAAESVVKVLGMTEAVRKARTLEHTAKVSDALKHLDTLTDEDYEQFGERASYFLGPISWLIADAGIDPIDGMKTLHVGLSCVVAVAKEAYEMGLAAGKD